MSDYPMNPLDPTPDQGDSQQPASQQPATSQPASQQPTEQRPASAPSPSATAPAPRPYAAQAPYPPQPQVPPQSQYPPQPQVPRRQKKPRTTLKALLAGIVGGLLATGGLVGALYLGGFFEPRTVQVSGGGQQITIDPADEDTTTANAVAAKALPSVVTVYTTYADGEGMGSGVIYDADGNIITNYHVIEDAESVSVTLNGTSYAAEVVGSDASSDIAVIRADFAGAEVTPMEVGSSSELQVGDWVMSVGSPFGLESSVSQGIVSALSRNTLLESSSGNTLYTNLIQTDATINPGNSGGALVNAEGQLVGICTLYSSDTESFAGIGYAIPSDYATQIADKIIAGEMVTHAYIGLSMQTVTERNASANGLSVDAGAYVVEVTEGSPADEAGIQAGDVITAIGELQVSSADSAILAVRSHNIGDEVVVKVMRGSEELSFDVTLGSDEALQQEQQRQQDETVNVNGEEISLEELIDLYEQYQEQQYQQQNSPFGGR